MLTEEEEKRIRELLDDPVRSAEQANKAIDAWVLQRKRSRKSSKNSRKP
jgi:hypothetical protein